MINAGDSTAVVKEQIEDAVALAGYSAPTSWADATDKINGTAGQFERDQIADGMNGGLARDRINALFGGPVWAPEGTQLTIDFAANKAWTRNNAVTDSVDAVSLTRAGSALMLGPDGYEEFPSGELARIDEVGAQVAPARVNKCTNYNAAPTDLTGVTKAGDAAATLTVVDDEVALRSAGFGRLIDEGKMNGKVYRLDNSLGTGGAYATIGGTVGNLNPHALSCFVRGGAGGLSWFLTIVGNNFPASSAYVRVSFVGTPDSDNRSARVHANPGSTVYFILNQLEEGSYASPPIITSGAAVSRPGDILTASVPEITEGVGGVIAIDLLQPPSAGNPRVLTISDGGNNNRVTLVMGNDGALLFSVTVGGSSEGVINLGPWATGRQVIAFGASAGFAMARRVGGELPSSISPSILPTGLSMVGLGGAGYNTGNNLYQITERLALNFGPQNADTFAQYWATAQEWAS